MTDTVIELRANSLTVNRVPLVAALLAADAAAPTGFAAQDVRFFFLLFTNWMGDDQLRPGADVDLTQVRRALQRLADTAMARPLPGRRWTLEPGGVLHLVEQLVDPRGARRFEEVVLVATVSASYAETIAARVATPAEQRRVRSRLDPRAVLRAERERLSAALADLEARRDAGPRLAATSRAALAAGEGVEGAAVALEARGTPYQLHAMRPLRELIRALPAPLQRFEMEHGMALRTRWMFTPLCDELVARIAILDRLAG